MCQHVGNVIVTGILHMTFVKDTGLPLLGNTPLDTWPWQSPPMPALPDVAV